MSTIDMTQVAGIQAVNAEGKVIGTLTVDDLTELVATKIVQEAKNEAVSARSASMMSEASTLAATDEYEDKLDIDTNPAYIRSLDTNGNPKRTAIASLASVVGGLLNPLFIFKEALATGTDLNTVKTAGIYRLTGSYPNAPFTQSWGCLIVLPISYGADYIQIAVESTSQYFEIYTRNDVSNSSSWKKIALSSV